MNYLLLKLAEEAGELVVAVLKHKLHRSPATLAKLEGEIADVLAIVALLMEGGGVSMKRVNAKQAARYSRELKRMKGKA